jgi:amino acid transporter
VLPVAAMAKVTKPPVFARDATGLVRTVSVNSSIIGVWMLISGGYPIFLLTYLGAFPGANFTLGFLASLIPMFAIALAWSWFAQAMPRSGGDYVYVTRGLNPFLGFFNSFAKLIAAIISFGVYAVFVSWYVGYQLVAMGLADSNASLIAAGTFIVSPIPSFVFAVVITFVCMLIAILTPKQAWGIVFWMGAIAVACTLVMFVILGTITQSTFQSAYDSFINTNTPFLIANGFTNATTYEQTITAGGWVPPSSVLMATLAVFPIACYSYNGNGYPGSWAGEIKQARRNMPLILMGNTVLILAYYILLMQLSINAFGQPFLTSWSNLSWNPAYSLPYALSDYIPFFAYLVYHNSLVIWVMSLALLIPAIFGYPPFFIWAVRTIFAMSFDRVLPEKLASVNDRTHTPIIATVVVAICTVFGSIMQTFYPSSTPTVVIPITVFSVILPCITAVVLPWWRKELYETAFVVKRKLLGIPVLTWAGIVSSVGMLLVGYSIFTSGLWTFHLIDYLFYAVAYGLSIVIFVAAYAIRKRSGLDLSLVFKQIPPE